MTAAAHFEAKKHAYRQTQDGIVISFVVHPNDVAAALATAPLGTRYMVAFAEIGENEQPIPSTDKPEQPKAVPAGGKRRFDELPRSQQAALMCKDSYFWQYVREFMAFDQELDPEENARAYILHMCGIPSRSRLGSGGDPDVCFDKVRWGFHQWSGRTAEVRG